MSSPRTKYVVIGIIGGLIVTIAVVYIVMFKNLAETVERDAAHPAVEESASSQTQSEMDEPRAAVPKGTLQQVTSGEASEPSTAPPAPQCTVDKDCDGPKLADCIAFRCVENVCVFDRSNCECTRNDQCDDNIPCTRDLCFSSTMKCIHIDEACR